MNRSIKLRREFLKTAQALAYASQPTEDQVELHLASVEQLVSELTGSEIRVALVPSGVAIAAVPLPSNEGKEAS